MIINYLFLVKKKKKRPRKNTMTTLSFLAWDFASKSIKRLEEPHNTEDRISDQTVKFPLYYSTLKGMQKPHVTDKIIKILLLLLLNRRELHSLPLMSSSAQRVWPTDRGTCNCRVNLHRARRLKMPSPKHHIKAHSTAKPGISPLSITPPLQWYCKTHAHMY